MSEETFRIVLAVAVLIACLAFVVQAGVMIALFRLTRKMQAKTAGFMEKAEPVLAKVEPVFDKIGPVIEKIGPALDSINAAVAKVGPAIDRFRPVVDRVGRRRTDRRAHSERQPGDRHCQPDHAGCPPPYRGHSLTKPSPSSVPGANRSSAWATFSTTRATAPMPVWSRSITPSNRSKTSPAP